LKTRARRIVLALAAAALGAGCGEDTPRGPELSSPAQREAAPSSPEVEAATERERREEQLEASGLREPEPGDTGYEPQ
jgi:hypothetical protein